MLTALDKSLSFETDDSERHKPKPESSIWGWYISIKIHQPIISYDTILFLSTLDQNSTQYIRCDSNMSTFLLHFLQTMTDFRNICHTIYWDILQHRNRIINIAATSLWEKFELHSNNFIYIELYIIAAQTKISR